MLKTIAAFNDAFKDYQKYMITALLTATNGSRTIAARCLGINRTTLVEMMARIGMKGWKPPQLPSIEYQKPDSLEIDGFNYHSKAPKCRHKPSKTTLIKIKLVLHAMENNKNVRSRAANELGMDRRTLDRLIETGKAMGFITHR